LDLALSNYQKSIEIQSQNVDNDKWLDSYCNIGHIYFVKKEYNIALNYYLKALDSSKKSKKKIDLSGILNNISTCYSELKQFDLAYKYASLHNELRDSIEFDYKKAVTLKEKYEQQKKDKEIAEKDKKIALIKVEKLEAESKKKSYFIYSLIGGLLLVTLLFFAIFKGNKLKQKQFLALKDIEIGKQKIEELLKKQELKSINAMIEGQEGERKRIARDLHDRLGSILSMVKIHFKSVEDNLDALKVSNLKQYEKANELLDSACDEVRKISHDMTSGVLSKFGLVAALEDLKDTLEQSEQLEVEFVTHGLDNRLENEVEIAVYRIIQELISNTLKYANATELSIQLLKSKNGLNVIVEDNGLGFDTKKEAKGIGLKNINSRVSALDGELNIDSIIGKGTTITIDIPLKEN
jgi:two-component system, NarL family, sensor kinase